MGGVILLYVKDNIIQSNYPRPKSRTQTHRIHFLNIVTGIALISICRPQAHPVLTDQYIYKQNSEISNSYDAVIFRSFQFTSC